MTGVVLADGTAVPADIVVANADAEHLYADLLPDPTRCARVRRAKRSTSGFVVLRRRAGTTPGIAHHNIWFTDELPGRVRPAGRRPARRRPDDLRVRRRR